MYGRGNPTLRGVVQSLPTPRASRGASTTETERLLKTQTSQLAVNGGSQHPDKRRAGGHGPTLADEVEKLLPTVQVADAEGGHKHRSGARSGELLLNGVAKELALLQTPMTTTATGVQELERRVGGRGAKDAPLLPTPTASTTNDGESPETWLARR